MAFHLNDPNNNGGTFAINAKYIPSRPAKNKNAEEMQRKALSKLSLND